MIERGFLHCNNERFQIGEMKNKEFFMEGLFVCLSIFFLIFIIGIFARSSSSSRQRAINAAWKKFASDSGSGITFERKIPFPKITGKYRELDYVLETVTEGTGEKV